MCAVPQKCAINALNFILIAKFLVGHYQEWSLNKKINSLAMIWCIFISFVIGIITSLLPNYWSQSFLLLGFFHSWDYYMHVITSLLTGERYFLNYLANLKTIDSTMKFELPQDTTYACVLHVLNVLFVIIYITSMYPKMTNPGPYMVVFFLISSGLGRMTKLIIFESLWKRMRLLRKWVQQNSTSDKSKTWKKCLYTYKHLLDNLRRTENIVKLTLLQEMPLAVLKFLILAYNAIAITINDSFQTDPWISLALINESICFFFALFAPSILLELTAKEHQMLQTMLAKDLLLNKDKSSESAMLLTKEYLLRRPPKYSLYRIVWIDASLVVGIASLCTTYTIVLLQFRLK